MQGRCGDGAHGLSAGAQHDSRSNDRISILVRWAVSSPRGLMTKLTDDLWRYVQVRPKENYACSEMPSKRDDQLGARIDTLRSILAGGPRGLGGPPDLKWAWENRRRCAICVSGMQRLEYRTHIATSILVGAFGVVALVGSVTSVVLGTMSKSGATGVIIGFIGLPLALYF